MYTTQFELDCQKIVAISVKAQRKSLVSSKTVLWHLKGTMNKELCYKKTGGHLGLIAYSDADWASDSSDRRSTTRSCFGLCGGGPVICWKTQKQATVALSTCEAEYMAMAATTQESISHTTTEWNGQ